MTGLLMLLAIALVLLVALLTAMLVHEMGDPPRHTAGYAMARGLACDPGELGLPFDSWTLDRPDGAQLAVWEVAVNHEPPRPRQLTCIFLHGWGHSRIDALTRIKSFLPLCDRLVL